MQTIYAYSYNPAIATGTNTTNTVWRMAYQQPIMLYKGTANSIKLVIFNNNQKVVDLTNYDVQVQIVDRETEEHFVTRTAINADPTTGVVTVEFTEADLRNLQHRFYHIIARLMPPGDNSTVIAGEILYLDDNYGAFTPVTIEDAWNYRAGLTAVADGVSNLDLSAVGNVIPITTNTYYLGNTTNQWNSLYTVNANLGNLSVRNSTIQSTNNSITFGVDTAYLAGDLLPGGPAGPDLTPQHSLGSVTRPWKDLHVSNSTIFIGGVPLTVNDAGNLLVNGNDVITNGITVGTRTNNINNPDAVAGVTAIRFEKQPFSVTDLGDGEILITSESSFNPIRINGVDGVRAVGEEPLNLIAGTGISIAANNTSSPKSITITSTGGGGAGPIQPYLELTNDPFIWEPYDGELVTFTKEDYATGAEATDEIDTGLAITRANQRGIYNPYLEADWDNTSSDSPSPVGTLWNKDGWTGLINLDQRIYLPFYETFLRFGNNMLAAEAIMYDVANDKYYKFDFTTWGNSNAGAPLEYTRTQLDPTTGEPIGSPVTFTKAGYADPATVNDPIDTNLTLARGNNQSIFNIALEPSYNSQGDGEDSPEGTEWNADGWLNLRNVAARTYDTFLSVMDYAIGNNVVGKELVMHDTINDKYYAVKFSSWTQDGNGGGFAYTRQLINTDQLFVKTDYGDEIDVFVEDDGDGAGIGITRGNNNGIYNPYREEGWDSNVSPAGTLWNTDGWDDLSNIETRNYQTFYDTFNGGLGNRVPGSKTVMYIPDTDEYYAIQWLTWTQGGNGGGFSYVRYKIDLTQLNQGIKFADGTKLLSAEGIGRIKSTASGDRRIEEVYGHKTVSVTSRVTQTAVEGTSFDTRTDYYLYLVWDQDLYNLYDGPTNFDIEISLDNATWYPADVVGSSGNNWLQIYLIGDRQLTVSTGDSIYYRISTGADPVVWWDKNDLPGGSGNFRGAVIDYHAYTGEATWIGTIHIVDDSGEEHITHTEVMSGSSDGENDDLWLVQNEGTISYRRIDGENKTLKIHWTAKVFYGSEYYD